MHVSVRRLPGYALAGSVLLSSIAWAGPAPTPGEPKATGLDVLAKATKRIPWSQAFQEKSQHFLIITNTTAELAKQMSGALEQQYKDFALRFQIGKEPKEALPVKVFAEKAEFTNYIRENNKKTAEHAVGFFDPNKKEIVLFWSDDPEDVLNTLYHEVTHYFVDLYAPRRDVPTWMNEGLAVYFETAQYKNGRLETGQIPFGRLLDLQDALKAGKNHKLSQLLKLEGYGAGQYDLLAYAEGWSLVYFFATFQGGKHGRLFGVYMEEIQKGRNPDLAFKKAFLVSPDELEPIWKKYVLELGMNSARGWFERGLAKYYDQNYEEALAHADQALKLDAKFAKALHLRGNLLYRLQKFPEALEALTQATTAEPTEPRSFYYLARVHEALHGTGDKRGSEALEEAAYLKAIQLKPDYADALGLLAWFYATADDPKLNKIKDAIPIAERAVELDATGDNLDTLAECYFQDQQTAKAIETEQKAMKADPGRLKYYQSQLQKFQEARKK